MEFDYGPNPLQGAGPIIETDIGIADAHKALLERQGLPVPPPIRCRFLIDTGASKSLVKHEIAERAGLKLINDSSPVHGIGVDTTGKTYFGRIWFRCKSKQVHGVQHTIGIDAQISSATLTQKMDLIDGLIGRDVLRFFELRYNGFEGNFSLRFLQPRHP